MTASLPALPFSFTVEGLDIGVDSKAAAGTRGHTKLRRDNAFKPREHLEALNISSQIDINILGSKAYSPLASISELMDKGPSIYDVHTEGSGSCGRIWSGWGQAPCGRPHRKLKLESTDVILSSSHAKKLLYFFTRISSLGGIKMEFFGDIN